MKKVLNVLGVVGANILTIVLTLLIFIYVLLLNIKSTVSKSGITNTFKNLDFVETLKNANDGVMWDDFKGLAEQLNLSEEQFEIILNSDKVKESIGSYLGEVINSLTNDKNANLTKEKISNFLNTAIDEYNKVSDKKISDKDRNKIVNSFNQEMIDNINEEIGQINLQETIPSENIKYIEFVDNVLFGSYTLIMLVLIIVITLLIALCRLSYYKWMSYLGNAIIIASILILFIGICLSIIPLQAMDGYAIINPIKNMITTKLYISTAILFIISIGLFIGHNLLKKKASNKQIQSKEDKVIEEKETKEEKIKEEVKTEDNKEKKKDKKKLIIIIILAILLLLLILFLIFRKDGSYTIVFDTDGGTEIASIEVKNGQIVNMPENPKKDGYTFAGWVDEDNNIITNGVEFKEDLTIKAVWISKKSKTNKITFDTNGGNKIDAALFEENNITRLPLAPTKDGYIFGGWLNSKNQIVQIGAPINGNTSLKAIWIPEKSKTNKITFDTDGGTEVYYIIIEKGTNIILPVNPTKAGYVFAGWTNENGESITKDTVITSNMKLTANWKQAYTCPKDCTPIGDGSKCNKIVTTAVIKVSACPSGYTLISGKCFNTNDRYMAENVGYCKDGSISDGACHQFKYKADDYTQCKDREFYDSDGYCVPYPNWKYECPTGTGYSIYTEKEHGGALIWCAKTTNKISVDGCPSGYKKEGNTCTKEQTVKCTKN